MKFKSWLRLAKKRPRRFLSSWQAGAGLGLAFLLPDFLSNRGEKYIPEKDSTEKDSLTLDVSAVYGVSMPSPVDEFSDQTIIFVDDSSIENKSDRHFDAERWVSKEEFNLELKTVDFWSGGLDYLLEASSPNWTVSDYQVYTLEYVRSPESGFLCYPEDEPKAAPDWFNADLMLVAGLALFAGSRGDDASSESIVEDDTPAEISGDVTGAVTEGDIGDAPVTASGSLSIADADADDTPAFVNTIEAGLYGVLVFENGNWTYTLDQAAVQALDAGDVVVDTITVSADDGTTQDIAITITGTQDAAVVSGTSSGAVTEGDIGDAPVTASGSLSIADADADDTPAFVNTIEAGLYGVLVFENGNWTYTLDQAAVQALDAGDVVVDTITVSADDGTTQDIAITITGTDEPSSVVTFNAMAGMFVASPEFVVDAFSSTGEKLFTVSANDAHELFLTKFGAEAELVGSRVLDDQTVSSIDVRLHDSFGDVIFSVVPGARYVDEYSRQELLLDTNLRAVVSIPKDAAREFSVTPFTEMAVQMVEKAESDARGEVVTLSPSDSAGASVIVENYHLASVAVQQMVGVDIENTIAVATTSSDFEKEEGDLDDSVLAARQYGMKLAALSEMSAKIAESMEEATENTVSLGLNKLLGNQVIAYDKPDDRGAIELKDVLEFTYAQAELTAGLDSYSSRNDLVVNYEMTAGIVPKDAISPLAASIYAITPTYVVGQADLIDRLNYLKTTDFLEFKVIFDNTVYTVSYDQTLEDFVSDSPALEILSSDLDTGFVNWVLTPESVISVGDSIAIVVTDSAENATLTTTTYEELLDPVDNFINGSSDPNHSALVGQGDSDFLNGLGGDDLLYGTDGHDVLIGGPEDDVLVGSAGDDLLYGGDGDDFVFAGDGDDRYFADYSTPDGGISNVSGVYLGTQNYVVGGEGFDTAIFSKSLDDYQFRLLSDLEVNHLNTLIDDTQFRNVSGGYEKDFFSYGQAVVEVVYQASSESGEALVQSNVVQMESLKFSDDTSLRVVDAGNENTAQGNMSGSAGNDLFTLLNFQADTNVNMLIDGFVLGEDTIDFEGIYHQSDFSPLTEVDLDLGATSVEIDLSEFVNANGHELDGLITLQLADPTASSGTKNLIGDDHVDLLGSDWWRDFSSDLLEGLST